MISKNIENCKKCDNLGHSCPDGPYIQIGQGNGRKILIVAESPAKNGWRISGRAFYTPEGKMLATGKRLNDYLKKLDLGVEKISFTEMAKCYLVDRKLLEKSSHNCFEFLEAQISALNPALIITLGVIPNKVFSKEYGITLPMGVLHTVGVFKYLPLYHPSPASPYGHKNNLEILERPNKPLSKLIYS